MNNITILNLAFIVNEEFCGSWRVLSDKMDNTPPRSAYVDSIHNAPRQYCLSKGKYSFAEKTDVTFQTIELVRCEQCFLDACQGEDTSMPRFLVHSFGNS